MAFAGSESPKAEPPTLTAIDQEISATAEYLKSSANVTTLNSASKFYNTSRLLVLLLRSGVDCSNLVDSYLTEISTNYVSNGDLTLEEPITAYAYLSIVLALSGRDATDFNGINLIKKYENAIINADQTALNGIIPYKLPHLYAAAYAYSKEFTDRSTCLSKLKTAILSNSNANGINYWGNSADNNGLGLAGLSNLSLTDNLVKTLVNNAITFSQTLLKEDGTSAGDFQWTPSPNADSTAASLILYATYDKSELAAKSYVGLLTFKASDSTGAYKYAIADQVSDFYATIDAYYALISYKAVLENQVSPFDISDTSEGIYTQVIEKINTLPSTITLNDTETLESIAVLYNRLSTVFKTKVTNYTLYQTAVNSYNELVVAEFLKNDGAKSDMSATGDTNVDLVTDINVQSPATGDSSSPAIYFFITAIAACCIVSAKFIYISNNNRKNA